MYFFLTENRLLQQRAFEGGLINLHCRFASLKKLFRTTSYLQEYHHVKEAKIIDFLTEQLMSPYRDLITDNPDRSRKLSLISIFSAFSKELDTTEAIIAQHLTSVGDSV